jgi:hypothetical protein
MEMDRRRAEECLKKRTARTASERDKTSWAFFFSVMIL